MLKTRLYLRAFVVFILLFTTPSSTNQRYGGQERSSLSLGFAFRVVREDKSSAGAPTWIVLVKIPEDAYTRDNLELLWHHFCQKYSDETQNLDLRISVDRFSNTTTRPSPSDRTITFQERGFDASFLRQCDGALAVGGCNELLIYRARLDDSTELERIVLRGKDTLDRFAYVGNPESDFVTAAAKKDLVRLNALLREHININARNNQGATALMQAALWGDLAIVRILLDQGADINAQDEGGWTALICASSHGNNEIVQLLLDRGADVNMKNSVGMSALTRAINDGRTETFRLLLARGAVIEFKDESGNTPLMLAAQLNRTEILLDLIKLTDEIDARNKEGETPLIRVFDEQSAIALLNKGADINARTKDGSTALMYAFRNPKKISALLDRGADPNVRNADGKTVLGIAQEHAGLEEVIQILKKAGAKP